jgi:hypothetical protein
MENDVLLQHLRVSEHLSTHLIDVQEVDPDPTQKKTGAPVVPVGR